IGVVGLNIALNCTLIWTPLREAGLAWSTAVCAAVQVALLLGLVRGLQSRGGADACIDRAVRSSWMKTALLAGAMALAVAGVGMLLREIRPGEASWVRSLVDLGAMV